MAQLGANPVPDAPGHPHPENPGGRWRTDSPGWRRNPHQGDAGALELSPVTWIRRDHRAQFPGQSDHLLHLGEGGHGRNAMGVHDEEHVVTGRGQVGVGQHLDIEHASVALNVRPR